jgi:hypothetical protein
MFIMQTTIKASKMFTISVSDVQRTEQSRVHILVIDKTSFMTEHELMKLDVRLPQYKARKKSFGGIVSFWRRLQTVG